MKSSSPSQLHQCMSPWYRNSVCATLPLVIHGKPSTGRGLFSVTVTSLTLCFPIPPLIFPFIHSTSKHLYSANYMQSIVKSRRGKRKKRIWGIEEERLGLPYEKKNSAISQLLPPPAGLRGAGSAAWPKALVFTLFTSRDTGLSKLVHCGSPGHSGCDCLLFHLKKRQMKIRKVK